MSILQKLTEGIVNRDMKKEGAALLSKWEQTGLLEGLGSEGAKNNMSRLLENQAKELLREAASSMASGDVEGFAAVAFPIVRRVFGGLIANELVSVQPMSLPSGLIFFMDFTFGGTPGTAGQTPRLGYAVDTSLYGGGKVGSQITGGVDLTGDEGTAAKSFYNLSTGYSSPTGTTTGAVLNVVASGTYGKGLVGAGGPYTAAGPAAGVSISDADILSAIMQYDQDITSGSQFVIAAGLVSDFDQVNLANLGSIPDIPSTNAGAALAADCLDTNQFMLRRLTQFSKSDDFQTTNKDQLRFVFVDTSTTSTDADDLANRVARLTCSFAQTDDFAAANAVGAVVGQTAWGLENNTDIPEINLKVDSVSVTARTKKLKAKWTPELGQDLNAYHNLDAEVELTSILSEQIALEIDREILEDLVEGATAGTYFWSRSPGLFVDKETGAEVGASTAAPDFTGTVSEWYETLLETINDISAAIHRKTLRGGANFIVCGPEVANILEFTAGFRASVTVDAKGVAGAEKVGNLSKKFDVYVDPYFHRNVVLVGRKGNSFLESGYVYAPYVPLQVTPTIFGTEDFVPRKGVMTRYAKKMVRPDMYGLVICRGLLGESGA